MREARRRMHFGVRSASGTADEERIGVIFLGCAGQERKRREIPRFARSNESIALYHASVLAARTDK